MVANGLVFAAVGVWAVMGVYVSIVDVREAIIPRQACWTGGGAVLALLAAAAGVEAASAPLRTSATATGIRAFSGGEVSLRA